MVNEIYLASIRFSYDSASKVRPVLIIKQNSFGDFIFLPLTTNLQLKGFEINNSNLRDGYLPKISLIIYEKPGLIAPELLIKKLASLNTDSFKKVQALLIDFFSMED